MLLAPDGTLIYKRRHSLPISVDSEDVPGLAGSQSATGHMLFVTSFLCLQLSRMARGIMLSTGTFIYLCFT